MANKDFPRKKVKLVAKQLRKIKKTTKQLNEQVEEHVELLRQLDFTGLDNESSNDESSANTNFTNCDESSHSSNGSHQTPMEDSSAEFNPTDPSATLPTCTPRNMKLEPRYSTESESSPWVASSRYIRRTENIKKCTWSPFLMSNLSPGEDKRPVPLPRIPFCQVNERKEEILFDWREGQFAWIKFTRYSKDLPGIVLHTQHGNMLRTITLKGEISKYKYRFYSSRDRIKNNL